MTRPEDEMGSQTVSSESDISHPILVYRSRGQLPSSTVADPGFESRGGGGGAWTSKTPKLVIATRS